MRNERELLVDCLERLNRAEIPYLLTGSMASNYWGIPRSTHDLDFVLLMQPGDLERFVAAFREGFFLQPDSVRRAFRPPHQFNAIDELSALKVDFWLLTGNEFERNVFRRRQTVTLFGTPASIVTAEDVILHKLYWNRLTPSQRQLGDAAGVYAVQRNALDLHYLREWGDALGVRAELEEILSGSIRPKST